MTDPIRAFEEAYAARSGLTVQFLHRAGRYGEVCDCGEAGCEGFRMGHQWEDAIIEDQMRSDPDDRLDPNDIYANFLSGSLLFSTRPEGKGEAPAQEWAYRDSVVDPRGGYEGGLDENGLEWHRHIPAEELEAEAVKTRGWFLTPRARPALYLNYPELGPEYGLAARHLWDVYAGASDWFRLKKVDR